MSESLECCPVFDPKPWDGVTHSWANKLFLKDTIPQIFHMPWPPLLSKKIAKMWNTSKELGIATELKDFLLLAYDPSPWKSELYLLVQKEHEEADIKNMSGEFYSRVFDGPYSAVPKYLKEIKADIGAKGKREGKIYFYFTTCPNCAKKYGHNYIVAVAEVV
jgi:hypothetical protein